MNSYVILILDRDNLFMEATGNTMLNGRYIMIPMSEQTVH